MDPISAQQYVIRGQSLHQKESYQGCSWLHSQINWQDPYKSYWDPSDALNTQTSGVQFLLTRLKNLEYDLLHYIISKTPIDEYTVGR